MAYKQPRFDLVDSLISLLPLMNRFNKWCWPMLTCASWSEPIRSYRSRFRYVSKEERAWWQKNEAAAMSIEWLYASSRVIFHWSFTNAFFRVWVIDVGCKLNSAPIRTVYLWPVGRNNWYVLMLNVIIGRKPLYIIQRTLIGTLSDTWVNERHITHDPSKHFESIIVLNHVYVWSIESHGWPKTFVCNSGLQGGNTFGDMCRQRSSRVEWTPFLPPFLPPFLMPFLMPTQRRLNSGTTAVQRRYNGDQTARASFWKPYFVRTYVSYVGPHTWSCRSDAISG